MAAEADAAVREALANACQRIRCRVIETLRVGAFHAAKAMASPHPTAATTIDLRRSHSRRGMAHASPLYARLIQTEIAASQDARNPVLAVRVNHEIVLAVVDVGTVLALPGLVLRVLLGHPRETVAIRHETAAVADVDGQPQNAPVPVPVFLAATETTSLR